MIEIVDLYKYYGSRRAVGPLSVTIQQGEIVGLLGLNGAGKTTTLRVLACDLLPTSGTVRVDGVDVVENPQEVRAHTGYLPESPPLYGEMTVVEFLAFAARLRGVAGSEVQLRVDETLEVTRLTKARDEAIATLSHGYRQRVGIAQAIVHQPRLVVLDEPISGLDPKQIVGMRRLVRRLGGKHTVLISSHILSEISETCDRILVIADGRISAAGTEAELSSLLLAGVRMRLTVLHTDALGPREIADLVAAVEGVTDVHPVEPSEVGERVLSWSLESSRDVRHEVARAIVQAGVPLLEIGRMEHALESVFLQLTGADEEGTKTKEEAA
ncbi:ABC transporter ATP-binding protein [Myxococcota bacterium]